MAELEARFQIAQNESAFLWCYELPENRKVSIGKTPMSQIKAEPHNRSEWVVPDPDNYVSGLHVFVDWNPATARLSVERKMTPKPTKNEIFFKGEAKNEFQMSIGDFFLIGRFSFQLHEQKSDTADSQDLLGAITNTVARPSQAKIPFNPRGDDSGDPVIRALKRLPDVIRTSRKEQDRYQALLRFVLSIVPHVDIAAVVEATLDDPKAGGPRADPGHCRVTVRQVESRRPDNRVDEFRVSRTLTKLALFTNAENTLWVRGKNNNNELRQVDLTSLDVSTEWAICAPLFASDNRRQQMGLYLVGTLPKSRDPNAPIPPELLNAQEVIDTSVQIFKSVHELLQAKEKVTRYEHYLPKRISEILTLSNARETQQPRETDVTVLFCDLRGSCKEAEAGAADLVAEWKQISDVLSDMTAAIINNNGVVGDLVGDAAMGFWGWPFDDADQTLKAARAAMHILQNFRRTAYRTGRQYRCGIGIAHGKAVAGEIGPFDFRKFGVFGPVVNLASRLEGMTKIVGVPILIDENVAAVLHARDPEEKEFMLRRFPVVRPAGMTLQTRLYELCPPGSYGPDYLEVWDRAVREFEKGRWNKMSEQLDRLDQLIVDPTSSTRSTTMTASDFLNGVSQDPEFLKKRSDPAFLERWDGVIRLDRKS
ncbi:adenylate/guanylate cyclase domain-containing protein [Zavarzinella formosa]|uniref:adenylate/guanylate cyclase domain-containing protein n=1 Tax=Zavarzinella formosa TaxID=360055 RepID=UPI0002FCB906|nr:adenylate/guanylate cyclase domain-containing protein [Zavarzinella formosa]